jgi:SAM-dependent methyltransferase
MTSLKDHKRLAWLIERAAKRALAAIAESPGLDPVVAPEPQPEPPPGPEPGSPARFARSFEPGHLAGPRAGASRTLYERLDAADVAEVEQLIAQTGELQALYAARPDIESSRHMILAFGTWLGVQAVIEKTGISAVQPPDQIHVMARGPLAAAGGLYEADMVCDSLASVGVDLSTMRSVLDFGCSSGRVVRALAAAYPAVRWYGCDPNAPAIDWANENLPDVEFFVSGDRPPLSLADGSLDLGYAISIWSHFAPELGLRWFEEMHRVIRPDGYLVCTTHGLTSVALYAQLCLRTPQQSDEILGALYRQGWWYAPEFGEQGDWGVVNPDWGTAFLSPEWMLAQLCPQWRVLEFASGRNQDNQDIYVLQRV